MTNNQQQTDLLCRCRLFEGIEREKCEKLLSEAPFSARVYKKGERIAFPRPALGILFTGKTKVCGMTDRRSAVINEMAPGALFGFASLFERQGAFESEVIAASAAKVLWLPEEDLCRMIRSCPAIAFNVMAMQSEKIRFLNRRIRAFTSCGGEEKLKNYLLSLEKSNDGTVTVPLGMTALSKRLGVSRATLYRAFEKLEREGTVVGETQRTWRIV
ncbi:MAG: Crp/Fnr family transcriptional regulator [Clostridia bacterium]|nr:Crp/Fnr family transcriptional regulator [Clostridia bacterium]